MKFEIRAFRFPCLLLMVLLLFGSALTADDDLIFVPIGLDTIAFPFEEVLANDPAGSNVTSWEAPTRGQLVAANREFVYQPWADFWLEGIDTFRYTTISGGALGSQATLTTFTVYLLADDHTIQQQEDFESGGFDMSFFVLEDPAGAMTVSSASPLNGNWSLHVDLDLPGLSGARNGKPSDPRCDGKLGHGLDGGGAYMGGNGTLVIDRGLGYADEVLYEVTLKRGFLGNSELCLRAREDGGTFRVAPCVEAPKGAMWITIGWRRNHAPAQQTPDGLLYLLIDGELALLEGSLDNWESELAYWQIGALQETGNITGILRLDDVTFYDSPRADPAR